MGFLGDSLGCLTTLKAKPKLEEVVNCILEVVNEPEEEWLEKIKQQSQILFAEIRQKSAKDIDIHLDYEEIRDIPSNDPLKVIVWFIMWLSRYNVKTNFIPDLCVVFAKILKVLDDKNLDIQDLDNKLVWNNVLKDCELLMTKFAYFNKNKDLILEFIKKVCHLIGKTFEQNNLHS